VAYRSAGRKTAVRVANTLLELPSQTFEAIAIVDRAGSTGFSDRAPSLEKSAPHFPRIVPDTDISGRPVHGLRSYRDAAPTGNAVPSLVAEVLAREIRAQLLDSPITTPLKLLPPRRADVPPAEKVRSVSAKYRDLIGVHKPHPGEGKGRKATSRKRQLADQKKLLEAGE
jgi:hypothetical protein